ncbi:MAG TPA: hypothetical protein VI935_11715 [Thermodesulfobacteriota bacterium]|nr:hypothetical protein [Thermodesulfobacteriota bacterium]
MRSKPFLTLFLTLGFALAFSVSSPSFAGGHSMMHGSFTKASDLRLALNSLLREHVFLAAAATDAALGGRNTEFQAEAGALDANSVDLSKAIGSVYGPDAEKAFLPLWRKHIGFFVDYTVGVATKDKANQEKAVSDLVQYTKDFGAFMHSASPALPVNVVADLVKTHVLTLKAVVDAQAAKNWAQADSDFFTECKNFTFTFVKPGTYPYFCKRHNPMRGEIKVVPSTP